MTGGAAGVLVPGSVQVAHPERLEMFPHLGRFGPYLVEECIIRHPRLLPLIGWGQGLQTGELVLHAGGLDEDALRISLTGFDLSLVEDVFIRDLAGLVVVFY